MGLGTELCKHPGLKKRLGRRLKKEMRKINIKKKRKKKGGKPRTPLAVLGEWRRRKVQVGS